MHPKSKFYFKRIILLSASAVLSACQLASVKINSAETRDLSSFGDTAQTISTVPDSEFYPTNELIREANKQFKERNFGKSYALFKKSVEIFPKDPTAWLGFAASADHIGRFDISDESYKILSRMIPRRIEYLNNLGYSYLLRGDLKKARRYFLKAFEVDPANEFTANNLELLRNSVEFAKRG